MAEACLAARGCSKKATSKAASREEDEAYRSARQVLRAIRTPLAPLSTVPYKIYSESFRGDAPQANPRGSPRPDYHSVQFGDLPFFARPTLGGNRVLRGYIEGRWRNDAAWEAAAEYGVWVFSRGFTVWRHIRIERRGLAVF